jgi:glycosyltransferase involved in cell wall biosynthesis
VLFFLSSLVGGGAERQMIRLLEHLDRERFEPRLALARLTGDFLPAVPPDVPVVGLAPRWIESSTLGVMMAIRPLRTLVREWAPSILFSSLNHANLAALRALAPLRNRAPSVEEQRRRPRSIVCVQNTLSAHRGSLRGRFMLSALARDYPAADAVVCVSAGVGRDLETLCPAVAPRIVVIPNVGYDSDLAARIAEPVPEGVPPGPLVVACGRLVRQKGFDVLLHAIVQVRRRHPVHVWMLGRGPELANLQALCNDLGLAPYVHFLGFKANPHAYMAKADVFVLSSRWEGFGNVLPEAMACGVPVLSTRCRWGPDEIVSDGVTGLLCHPESAEALANGILTLIEDRGLAARLATAAKHESRRYSPEAVVARHEELFVRLAG